ncbi:MAG TPA: hypothetical protein VK867_07235 [Candidatus Limnocylindrales bacterium]|nr:hypothetical protein [Candidatus Limnocylindrales bacterium]
MRVPAAPGRAVALVAALFITALVVMAPPAASAAGTAPLGLTRFKAAVGSVESGGRYDARNPRTGAYGKYQILPANWPSWARRYIGSASARQTPRNQERVASGKMTSLYRWLGTWRRVAYWWLTGSDRRSGWSPAARLYVTKVMARFGHGAKPSSAMRLVADRSAAIDYDGRWQTARHRGYRGGTVRYATGRGATATMTFTGRGVTWYGPTGPTRGKAKVYVDGRLVTTVDLRRSGFHARAAVFSKRWATSRRHTIRIVVVGTSGRSMVAIDEFAIRK